jgi:hypothetical protein
MLSATFFRNATLCQHARQRQSNGRALTQRQKLPAQGGKENGEGKEGEN